MECLLFFFEPQERHPGCGLLFSFKMLLSATSEQFRSADGTKHVFSRVREYFDFPVDLISFCKLWTWSTSIALSKNVTSMMAVGLWLHYIVALHVSPGEILPKVIWETGKEVGVAFVLSNWLSAISIFLTIFFQKLVNLKCKVWFPISGKCRTTKKRKHFIV